jgi:predicted transcriptional regulator
VKRELNVSEAELKNRIGALENQVLQMQQASSIVEEGVEELTTEEKLDLISYMVEKNGADLALIKGGMIGAFATCIAVAALQYFSIF